MPSLGPSSTSTSVSNWRPSCPAVCSSTTASGPWRAPSKSDAGAEIRDGIKVVARLGAPHETLWPYDIAKFTQKPSAKVYQDALKHRAISYFRIDHTSLDELLACLAGGFPFVFGFTVYESFESPEVSKTGVVQMPGYGERVVGGHAVLAVGYDQKSERFLVRNSWGTAWGQKGYFTMPYHYLTNGDLEVVCKKLFKSGHAGPDIPSAQAPYAQRQQLVFAMHAAQDVAHRRLEEDIPVSFAPCSPSLPVGGICSAT